MNSSNGFESGERNFMKVIHSIFAILLSIACILYLFLRPGQNNILFHSFSTKALVAESEHNTFSNALQLCTETTYQEHIAKDMTTDIITLLFRKMPIFRLRPSLFAT